MKTGRVKCDGKKIKKAVCVNIKSLGQSSRRKTVKQSGYFGRKGLDWDLNWCKVKVIDQRGGFDKINASD